MKRTLLGAMLVATLFLGACEDSSTSPSPQKPTRPAAVDPALRAEVDADLRRLVSDPRALEMLMGLASMSNRSIVGGAAGRAVRSGCINPQITTETTEDGVKTDTMMFVDVNGNYLPGCPVPQNGAPLHMRMKSSTVSDTATTLMNLLMSMTVVSSQTSSTVDMSATGSMTYQGRDGFVMNVNPITMSSSLKMTQGSEDPSGYMSMGFTFTFLDGKYTVPMTMRMTFPDQKMTVGEIVILRDGKLAGTMRMTENGTFQIFNVDGQLITSNTVTG